MVEILEVGPMPDMPWGYTGMSFCSSFRRASLTDSAGVFELNNGGGLFARDFDTKAAKAIWDFGAFSCSSLTPPH